MLYAVNNSQIKILALGLLFILFTTASTAQIRLGPIVGINISNNTDFNNSPYTLRSESKTRGLIGIALNLNVLPSIGIESGLMLSFKGATNTLNYSSSFTGSIQVSGERKFTYLELPINFCYTRYFDRFNAGIFAGPSVSLFLGGEETIESKKYDIEYMPLIDPGVSVGLKAESNRGIGLKLQYVRGFSNIWESDYSKSYNKVINLSAYYLFGNDVD